MAPVLRAGHLAARRRGGARAAPPVTGAVRNRPPGSPAAAVTKAEAAAPARAPELSAGAQGAEPSATPPQTGSLPQKAVAPPRPPPAPATFPGRIACAKTGGRCAGAGNSTTVARTPGTRNEGKTCPGQAGWPGPRKAGPRGFRLIAPVPGCRALATRRGPGGAQCGA